MGVHDELVKAIQNNYESFRRALDSILDYLDAHPDEVALRIHTLNALSRYKHRLDSEVVPIAGRVLERLSPHASRGVLLTMLHKGHSPYNDTKLGKEFSELAVGYMRDHAGAYDWGKVVKDYLFGIHRNPKYTQITTLYPWTAPAVEAIIRGLREDPQAFESALPALTLYDHAATRDMYRASVDETTALHAAATLAREYDPTMVFDFHYGVRHAFGYADPTAEHLPFAETLWGTGESLARHLVDYFLDYSPLDYGGLMDAALQKYGRDPQQAAWFTDAMLNGIKRTFAAGVQDDFGVRPVLLGWLRSLALSPHAPVREHIARELTRLLGEYPGMVHSVRDMMWQAAHEAQDTPYELIGIGHTIHHTGPDELGWVGEPVLESAFFRAPPRLSSAYGISGFKQPWARLYERLHEAGLPPDVFDAATIRAAVERASEDPEWLLEFLRLGRGEPANAIPMKMLGLVMADFVHKHRPEWHDPLVAHLLDALNPSALEHANRWIVEDVFRLWTAFASYIAGSRVYNDTPPPAIVGRTVPVVLTLARAMQHHERLELFHETIGDVFGRVVSAQGTDEAVRTLFVLTAPHDVLTHTIRVPAVNTDDWHEWLCRELAGGA